MARLDLDLAVALGRFRFAGAIDLRFDGIAAAVGPSGSGKTTLLRAIAGLEPGARGRLAFDGETWLDDARAVRVPAHRRGAALVFQDGRLFPHLTVRGNLLFGWKRGAGSSPRLEPERVFRTLDLERLLERDVTALSGGERQRVAIGRALLASPRLLLMDEPLASIDVGRRQELLPFIERLPGEFAIPILYVTHAFDEMLRLAGTALVLEDGRVAGMGSPEAVAPVVDRVLGVALDAGTVVSGVVREYDAAYGLARIALPGAEIRLRSAPAEIGSTRRLRIRARDVALALEAPSRASFLNVLPGTVVSVAASSAADADVVVDVGVPLLSRITRRSADDLGLRPGTRVFALVKAVALDAPSSPAAR